MNPLLLLLGTALAGVDGHGPLPPPTDGDPGRPLRVGSGPALDGGAIGVVGEYADEPLNLFVDDGSGEVPEAQLDDLLLANLQLAAGLGRIGLGAVIPMAPVVGGAAGDGPALVDPSVQARLTLLDGEVGGLSLLPEARLPLGADARYLGTGGLAAGLRVAGSVSPGPLRASAELGLEGRPVTREDGLEFGGSQAVAGLALGGVWTRPGLGAHLELVGAYGLGSTTGSTVPVELSGTVRGGHGRAWWVAGGGAGLTEGIGSAALRLFAGAGVRWGGPEEEVEPEVAEEVPQTPPEESLPGTEVVVRVQDVRGAEPPAEVRFEGPEAVVAPVVAGRARAQLRPGRWTLVVEAEGFGSQTRTVAVGGEPVALEAVLLEEAGPGEIRVEATDVEGQPASDARALVDGLPVGALGAGTLVVGGLAEGAHAVALRGRGLVGVEGEVHTGEGLERTLYPVEGSLEVVVSDASGAPVPDARVTLAGPDRLPAVPLEGAARRHFVLSPGTWTVLVTSESHGVQVREVVLEDEAWTTARAVFVLGAGENGPADLRVRVVDVAGRPVEGAVVHWKGVSLGQTASGGDLRVDGLGLGAGDLSVELPGAETVPVRELVLQPGLQEAWVTVAWKPGTIRLRVRQPGGPVGDAVVLASGPVARRPFALGPTGIATWQLAPGEWEILVTSEEWGTASRRVTLSEDPGARTEVEVVLLPKRVAGRRAELELSVLDPEGAPVVGAAARADDTALGRTTEAGLQASLLPGLQTLSVEAGGFEPWVEDRVLKLGPNAVEAELAWRGRVDLQVLAPDGSPAVDATVRLVGPETTAPVPVDGDGRRSLTVAPGPWQALALSATHGVGAAEVDWPEGEAIASQVIRIPPVDRGGLVVEVRDELGRPVADARAECPGCEASTGAAGLVSLSGIAGPIELALSAPHHQPTTVQVDPAAGPVRLALMEAVPVPVRVAVNGPEGSPVAATVRFVGAVEVAPVRTGEDGAEVVAVIPGEWAVTAESEGFGVRRRDIVVEPGATELRLDFALGASRVSVADGAVRIEERVHFDLGSAVLRTSSDAILQEVADTLVARPELAVVEVGGHTDATGDLAVNQRLSEERAEAVRAALVRLGVAPSRLVARGYGPTRPIDESGTGTAHQANRRVEFAVLESSVQ